METRIWQDANDNGGGIMILVAVVVGVIGVACGILAVFGCMLSSQISQMDEMLDNDIMWRKRLAQQVSRLRHGGGKDEFKRGRD